MFKKLLTNLLRQRPKKARPKWVKVGESVTTVSKAVAKAVAPMTAHQRAKALGYNWSRRTRWIVTVMELQKDPNGEEFVVVHLDKYVKVYENNDSKPRGHKRGYKLGTGENGAKLKALLEDKKKNRGVELLRLLTLIVRIERSMDKVRESRRNARIERSKKRFWGLYDALKWADVRKARAAMYWQQMVEMASSLRRRASWIFKVDANGRIYVDPETLDFLRARRWNLWSQVVDFVKEINNVPEDQVSLFWLKSKLTCA